MSGAGPTPETGVDDPRRGAPWVVGVIKVMSRVNRWAYRVSGGRVGGSWRVGSALRAPVPVCLVTTTGRKSGEPRTVPLHHLPDGTGSCSSPPRADSPSIPSGITTCWPTRTSPSR